MFGILYLINYWFLFHYLFFQEFSFALLIETNSSTFSFCLTLPLIGKWQSAPVFLPGKFHAQRNLAGHSPRGHKESDTSERLSTCEFRWSSFLALSWKGVLVWKRSHTYCIPGAFSEKSRFDVDTSHVFPQSLLAALTSSGVRLEMERLELELGMRPGFPSAQWLLAPYRGGVLSQVAGAQDLRVGPKVTLFSLSVYFLLSQHWDPCSREREHKSRVGVRSYVSSQLVSAADRGLSWLHYIPCSAQM